VGVKGTSFLLKVEKAYVCLNVAIFGFFISFHLWKDYGTLKKYRPLFYRQNRKCESSHRTWGIGVCRIPVRAQKTRMGAFNLTLDVALIIPTQLQS